VDERVEAAGGGMARPVVVLDVHGCRADLALVDVMLRVVLAGRRLGADVRVLGAGPGVLRLLALTGLDDVLAELDVLGTPQESPDGDCGRPGD
jgi:hypothetical protein